jgi:hypothetical protein
MHQASARVEGASLVPPRPCGRGGRSTPSTPPAACTTPWPNGPAGSESTTTRRGHRLAARREFAKAIPCGVYDVGNDEGWVSNGDVADTAEFAVEAIRRWWNRMGKARFPDGDRLLITADAGGSNGYRLRAWKVCHYPPGTSKWKRIVLYTGFPGVYQVTNEPAPDPVALARDRVSAS